MEDPIFVAMAMGSACVVASLVLGLAVSYGIHRWLAWRRRDHHWRRQHSLGKPVHEKEDGL